MQYTQLLMLSVLVSFSEVVMLVSVSPRRGPLRGADNPLPTRTGLENRNPTDKPTVLFDACRRRVSDGVSTVTD